VPSFQQQKVAGEIRRNGQAQPVQTNKAAETVPEKDLMVGMVGMLNKDFITTA
jgi:hypothetical protein